MKINPTEPQILDLTDPNVHVTVHPAVKRFHEWKSGNNDADPMFIALLEDIRERGIDQPLIMDPQHRIIDGRERWKAAKKLQLTELPVMIREEIEALEIALANFVHRKHFTRSGLAYLTYPLFEPWMEAIRMRQLENLKQGKNAKTPYFSRASIPSTLGGTVEDFCEEKGFGRDLIFAAQYIHKRFAESDRALAKWEEHHPDAAPDDPRRPLDLRGEWEPKILAPDGVSLLRAKAGIEGEASTKGMARPETQAALKFYEGVKSANVSAQKWGGQWETFPRALQDQIRKEVQAFGRLLPEPLVTDLVKSFRERKG